MVQLPEIDDEQVVAEPEQVSDKCKVAVKMAWIGAGQAGGNLVDCFWKLGYRRVCAVNTTARDTKRLELPEKNQYILSGVDGAGKDPAVGRRACESEIEEIFKLMGRAFGQGCDHIMLCVGAGGGTGSGAAMPLVKLAKQYLYTLGVNDVDRRVGVVCTLPTKDESAAVQRNALDTVMPLVEMAEHGQLSPLVLIDNARVMQLYGRQSVVDVWDRANQNVCGLFHTFNLLGSVDDATCIVAFDPKDYQTVLQAGILVFGRTALEKVEQPTDVADAVRDNVRKGLLVEGLDISKATHGAAILVADDKNLARIPQDSFEAAFASLNRLMHQGPETKLHRGVYAGGKGIRLYTVLSGLGRPTQRLQEIAMKAGATYPLGG